MSAQGAFAIYCAELYKSARHLTGRQMEALFTRCRVWDYLFDCFEALHTTGPEYIIQDLDEFIRAR